MKKRIIIICWMLLGICQMHAQNWDINTVKKVNSWEVHNLSRGLSYSAIALPIGIPATMGIYALIKKDYPLFKDAFYIGTTVIEAAGLSLGLKYAFERQRPYDKYPGTFRPIEKEDSPSFPSTHTATAFALATSLSITYPKWYVIVPSTVWACGVGMARINQGVHYPSDVLAGAAIGIGCGFLNIYVNRWLNKVLLNEDGILKRLHLF